MIVEVLIFEGCPHGRSAVSLARKVVERSCPTAEVRVLYVEDADTAARMKFLGSPSIRVDGLDIEEARRDEQSLSYSCRVCRIDGVSAGVPSEEMLRRAMNIGS